MKHFGLSAVIAAAIVAAAVSTNTGRSAVSRSAVSCSGVSISIPAMSAGQPYPSTCVVSGLEGAITDVNVELTGLSHGYPDDIDLLLVSPIGQDAKALSDAGGSFTAVGLDVILDDEAIVDLPDGGPLRSTSYHPANWFEDVDLFPAPAPTPSGAVALSTFDGQVPNGTWKLYVVDDAPQDMGSIAAWSLDISTKAPPPPPQPPPPPPPPPQPPPPLPPPPPHPVKCHVPRVVGLRLGQARLKIRRGRCGVGSIRRVQSPRVGRVLRQTPRAGARRARGFPVNLTVGRR